MRVGRNTCFMFDGQIACFSLNLQQKGHKIANIPFAPWGKCIVAVFFPHHVQKMNIYESRKVVPDGKMHSAARPSDSWPMPEEPGRQINKSRQ